MRAEGYYKPKVKKEQWASSNGHYACPTGNLLNVQQATQVETNGLSQNGQKEKKSQW